MLSNFNKFGVVILLCATSNTMAANRIVNSTSNNANTVGTLPYWLLNADDGDTIDCSAIAGQTITLTSSLPAITKDFIINGAGITINGAGNYQAFQVASGTSTISNVQINNALSKGGNGGDGYSGAGGAVGGGGALYIHGGASVTLVASRLVNNVAQGGNGGSANNLRNSSAGGGGGFGGGNGGNSFFGVTTGGGGGGHSNGGMGGTDGSVNGSNGLYFGGAGGGAGFNSFTAGGSGGNAGLSGTFEGGLESGGNGGGGAGNNENGYSASGSGPSGVPGNGGQGIGTDSLFGCGGGGGSASASSAPGGTGIGAAGGGGGSNDAGGAGGILGGGGGAGSSSYGGAGGFGSGAGGAINGGIGGGSFSAGGGNGASDPSGVAAGGGGSGLGGAIFIQSGGELTVVNTPQIANNSALAGVGGSSTDASNPLYVAPGNGAAMGNDIFVREEGTIIFNLTNNLTITTPIEGDQTNGPNTSGGLIKLGTGILNLNGANTYSGITAIDGGTLNLNGSVIGSATIGSGGTLSGNATVSGNLTSSGIGSIIHADINGSGGTSLISVTGTASLAGTLEIALSPNAKPGTYTLLKASALNSIFDSVTFKGATPYKYSVSYLPVGVPTYVALKLVTGTSVTGNGTIAGAGVITFNLKATRNKNNQIVADMFYNDPAARVHFDNPVVTTLVFSESQVTLGGTVRVRNQQVNFITKLTDGNPAIFSLNLSNGYAVSGKLTSGSITVQ